MIVKIWALVFLPESADNFFMSVSDVIPVATRVLLNPYVIGAAIAVILYINFVYFVAKYRKKPPQPKRKKVIAAPAPAPAAPAEGGGDASGGGEAAAPAE